MAAYVAYARARDRLWISAVAPASAFFTRRGAMKRVGVRFFGRWASNEACVPPVANDDRTGGDIVELRRKWYLLVFLSAGNPALSSGHVSKLPGQGDR